MSRTTTELRLAAFRAPRHDGAHKGAVTGMGQNGLTLEVRPDRSQDRDCVRYEKCLAEVLAIKPLASCVCKPGCKHFVPVETHAVNLDRRET